LQKKGRRKSNSSDFNSGDNNSSDEGGDEESAATSATERVKRSIQDKILKPTFRDELSAFVEVVATAATRVECLRYHKVSTAVASVAGAGTVGGGGQDSQSRPGTAATNNSHAAAANSAGVRTCIIPLYEWFQISEERLQIFDVDNVSLSAGEILLLNSGSGSGSGGNLPPIDHGKGAILDCFADMGLEHQTKSRFVESACIQPAPLPVKKVNLLVEEAARRELVVSVERQLNAEERERKERAKQLELERRERIRQSKQPSIPGASRKTITSSATSTAETAAAAAVAAVAGSQPASPQNSINDGATAVDEQADDGGGNDSFMLTAEKSQATKMLIAKRSQLFRLNDKLCSDESDISRLSRALQQGKSTRNVHDDDEDGDEEDEGSSSSGLPSSRAMKELTPEQQEEVRKKRQNARRGLWESKGASPGMGLLNARMTVYETMVTLPTRDELRLTLEKSNKAESLSAAKNAVAAAAAAALSKSSAFLDASSNSGGGGSSSSNPSLNTKLRTVRTLVNQSLRGENKM
jgi:hypothetical protein